MIKLLTSIKQLSAALLLLFLLFSSLTNATAEDLNPIFTIRADSLYDAGYQLGKLASSRIHKWFKGEEMTALAQFVRGEGKESFASLKRDNTAAFPELIPELKGMAEGAQVPLEWIWMANLVPELESLMPAAFQVDHCTDIYSRDDGNILQGHNEDWSQAVKPLWYFVRLLPAKGANFTACAGVVYPGTLVGYAPTWSRTIYSTQNTLFPNRTRREGLGCIFVQRRAVCGSSNVEQAVERLETGGWAASASVNLVDLTTTGDMVNVEAYEDDSSWVHVDTNYSHMNMFQHLPTGIRADRGDPSTLHRRERIWQLPPPRSVTEMATLLGDTQDRHYPIYRQSTLMTLILHQHHLWVWINVNPQTAAPIYEWNLETFFDDEVDEGEREALA